MRLVRDIDDGDAWVVARFDALTGARLPAEVANQLPPINWFSARGFIDSGLEGQLRVETRDEASAQNLQEVIRGFMALGRLQTGQHPEFAEFLNSIQLAGDGKTRLAVVLAAVRDDRRAGSASRRTFQTEAGSGPSTRRDSHALRTEFRRIPRLR